MAEMKWDLSQLVESTDPEWIKGQLDAMVRDAGNLAGKYHARVETLTSAQLRGLLQEKDDLFLRYEGPMLYSPLLFAANQTDPVANRTFNAFSNANTKACQLLAFLSIELGRLLSHHPEMLDDPILADYKHYLERNLRVAPHLLSEAEEQIIMAKDQSGIAAWNRLQSKWLSTRQFKMIVNGKERNLSIGEMIPYIYDPDRAKRHAAYVAIGSTLGTDEVLWADALRAIWNDHFQMCKLRKYPSPLTSSLILNDVDQEAIDALMSVVDKNATLCQDYFRLKAKLLGLNVLGNWDLRAPLPNTPDPVRTWDQAYELMIAIYSRFDERYGKWVEDIFTGRRIDGEVRKGKRTGAFCESWIDGRSAFVLSSYNGQLNDVYTLAHELGHAVHAYLYTRSQNPSNCQVSLCVAECGSLFGELLLTEDLLSKAGTREEKQAILVKIMNSFAQTVFQEGFRYFFEMSIAEATEKGRFLDGNTISELWMAAQRKIYGDSVEFLPESRWDWARFPHHYFAEVRFYDYPYVFAQLFVFALYRLYKEQGETFKPKLDALLAAGSSRSAAQLAAELGFDIARPEFWQKGMDQAGEFLRQLEELG